MFFCFNDTATTEIYTLSLHDALPIWSRLRRRPRADRQALLHKLRRAPLRPGQGPLLTARRGRRANPRPLHVEWPPRRSEEHTSELQSRHLVCRLLLEKKKKTPSNQFL